MASNTFTKHYLRTIQVTQNILLAVSLSTMLLLPLFLSFSPERVPETLTGKLYTLSLAAVFFVMAIRPLADIFSKASWLRALVILRKGAGVLSASIIISFVFSKIITTGGAYFSTITTPEYWSLSNYLLLAHLGDISAVPLLLTSNKFSKRVLGVWWKRIQKLAYVYFYAGALYEIFVFGSAFAFVALVVVTTLVCVAFMINRMKPEQTV